VNYKIFPVNTPIRIDEVLNYSLRHYPSQAPEERRNSGERITLKALLY